MTRRIPMDLEAYNRRVQTGPCFICALAEGDAELRAANHVVYEDADVLIFLNRYPTLRGYTLVCPRRHLERVVGDASLDEYLGLQRWVHRVGRAVEQELPTERLYLLSLGSQQANRHVHWHVAPLPRGVAYEDQQLAALMMSRGILDISDAEQAELAGRLRTRLLASAD